MNITVTHQQALGLGLCQFLPDYVYIDSFKHVVKSDFTELVNGAGYSDDAPILLNNEFGSKGRPLSDQPLKAEQLTLEALALLKASTARPIGCFYNRHAEIQENGDGLDNWNELRIKREQLTDFITVRSYWAQAKNWDAHKKGVSINHEITKDTFGSKPLYHVVSNWIYPSWRQWKDRTQTFYSPEELQPQIELAKQLGADGVILFAPFGITQDQINLLTSL